MSTVLSRAAWNPEGPDDPHMPCPEPQRVIKPAEWPQKLLMALIMLELSGPGQVRPGKHTEQRLSHTRIRPEDCDYDVTFWQAAADWVTFVSLTPAWTPVNDQSMQTHTHAIQLSTKTKTNLLNLFERFFMKTSNIKN